MKKNIEYFFYFILYSTWRLNIFVKFIFFDFPVGCIKWLFNATLGIDLRKNKKSKFGYIEASKNNYKLYPFVSTVILSATFIWLFFFGNLIIIKLKPEIVNEYKNIISKLLFAISFLISTLLYLKMIKNKKQSIYFDYFSSMKKSTFYYTFIAIFYLFGPLLIEFFFDIL
jgi:hypothetical protein